MLRNRKGVTLIEIMTVVTMAILMTAVAFPKLKETRRAASMQSAKTQVESYLTVARSIAIRTGVRSFLVRQGNSLTILADSGGKLVPVVRKAKLDEISDIKLEATVDTIIYDSRGVAVNLAGTQKFYLTVRSGYGAGTMDSLCVTRLGLVLDRKCGMAALPPEKLEDPVILDPKLEDPILVTDPIIVTDPIVVGPIVVK